MKKACGNMERRDIEIDKPFDDIFTTKAQYCEMHCCEKKKSSVTPKNIGTRKSSIYNLLPIPLYNNYIACRKDR